MKIGLVTTTINVPKVLGLYSGFALTAGKMRGVDFAMFAAGDQKTPHAETQQFCEDMRVSYLHPDNHDCWKSAKAVGQNTDSLRNIAILEALKWNADIIFSCDDDMLPYDTRFFGFIENAFSGGYFGLCLGSPHQWFDAGEFTVPKARQRGLPLDVQTNANPSFVHNVSIGAMQGIILGIPDTDACTTVANDPAILSATDVLKSGFVVHPGAKAVFNSQLTAFRRELAPCFAQFYNHQQRNTDIIASIIMRRVMRERNLYTYFGPPTAFHARSPRPALNDLKAEMWGLTHIEAFTEALHRAPIAGKSVVEDCRTLINGLRGVGIITDGNIDAYNLWYDDCERVL